MYMKSTVPLAKVRIHLTCVFSRQLVVLNSLRLSRFGVAPHLAEPYSRLVRCITLQKVLMRQGCTSFRVSGSQLLCVSLCIECAVARVGR